MLAKWLSLTLNPPYIPIFYTLTVASVAGVERGRPIIMISVRWSHGADICICRSTHPANSAETKTRISKVRQTSGILLKVQNCLHIQSVSMDVTSLYTICHAYEDFYGDKAHLQCSLLCSRF